MIKIENNRKRLKWAQIKIAILNIDVFRVYIEHYVMDHCI